MPNPNPDKYPYTSHIVPQVQYSLLYRTPERNGVMDACKEHNVTLVAYSPLCQGLLTGKLMAWRLDKQSKAADTKRTGASVFHRQALQEDSLGMLLHM